MYYRITLGDLHFLISSISPGAEEGMMEMVVLTERLVIARHQIFAAKDQASS